MSERDEICSNIEILRGQLEGLVARGLRVAEPGDIKALDGVHAEFKRVGAEYLAARIKTLADALRNDDRGAAAALMRVQMTLQVFERVLTLDAVGDAYAAIDLTETAAAAPASVKGAPPPLEDRKKLLAMLDELSSAVEDLVQTGVTTASEATRQKLDVSFKEASRLKLLRLGASLRFVNDELARFLNSPENFSGKRFAFFLNRCWLLTRGMAEALRKNDEATLAQLLLSGAPPIPLASVEIVPLGVSKRVVQSSCAFDFKFRLLKDAGPLKSGQRLTWSCLYPNLAGVSAETQLHLPQPQKFKPKSLLENTSFTFTEVAVALDDTGGGRLILGPKTTVTQGKAFTEWKQFQSWDVPKSRARVAHHVPSPLDLPVEMQEEVVLTDWKLGAKMSRGRAEQDVYPLTLSNGVMFDAVVSTGPDGKELGAALDALRKNKTPPPLFGLMHYELCRFVFQPLASFDGAKMTQLMISTEKPDLAALLKSMGK